MKKKIQSELVDNTKYLIFSLLLSIYVFLPQSLIVHSFKQVISVFISIGILFLISKVNKIIFSLMALVILFINSILVHMSIHWGTASISSRLQAAFLSPNYEIFEYLSTYLNIYDVMIVIYTLIGTYLIYYLIRNLYHSYKMLRTISIVFLLLIVISLNALSLTRAIIPYKYINDVAKANEWKNLIDKRAEYLKKQKKHIIDTQNILYKKIVIIMGESANKNHMQAYGYSVHNTPYLSKLLQQDNSFKFDVIAPTNQTRYSVPIDLTDATVAHFYDFITSQSIISDFNDYGYKTYWLSNQYMSGRNDSYIASIAHEASYSQTANFVYEDGGGAESKKDGVLLDYLDALHFKKNTKELYVFHLLGSHFQYPKRYPKEHALFPNPKNVIEEYDNTIYYTDYILHEIYNRFKDTEALFIYVSDHGEVVSLEKSGHGFFPAFKSEYEIPLIIHSTINNERLLKLKNENKVRMTV